MADLSEERRNFILSEFSYIQLFKKPSDAKIYYKKKFTLGQIVKKVNIKNLKYDGSLTESDVKEIFKEIQADPKLSNLIFTNYENKNTSGNFDGFIAYSFKDSEGNAHFAFRGSESDTPEGQHDGFLGVDWTDNYTMGIEGKSRQFQDVESFVAANSVGSEKIYVTGHSKGGANALYACSQFPNATGIAFDAPGIDEAISGEARERLKESGMINFVASDDKVGALLFHSENRVFCKMNEVYYLELDDKIVKVSNYNKAAGQNATTDTFIPHALQAFFWDKNNNLVKVNRSSESVSNEGVQKVENIIKGGFSSTCGIYGAASTRMPIYVDFDKLREDSDRLEVLRRRARDIEGRINELYFNVDLRESILSLFKSSYMEYSSNKFKKNIYYLNYAYDTFEKAERKLFEMASR